MTLKYNDSWIRDIGGIYLQNDKGLRRMVKFRFNGWGMSNMNNLNSSNFKWDYMLDDNIAIEMANISQLDYYECPLVLEGGSILTDGEGTLYTTEECLLNPNRNSNFSKNEIEEYLKEYLNIEKIMWIPYGVYNDQTSGHVDNLIHIIAPGHVLLTWADKKSDPQYERSLKALNFLTSNTDAKNRKITVTKIKQPVPLFFTNKEATHREYSLRFASRIAGFRMPASYTNLYVFNKAVILPVFGNFIYDQQAIDIIKKCYPTRKVIPVYSREILLGGGNIHCITKNEM